MRTTPRVILILKQATSAAGLHKTLAQKLHVTVTPRYLFVLKCVQILPGVFSISLSTFRDFRQFWFILVFNIWTRKWHSESADPAKALGPSDILDCNPVVDISESCSFFLRPHRFINDHFSGHLVAVYSIGEDWRLRRWRLWVESPVSMKFYKCPRIRTVTKYKIEKFSVVTGDRTHNLHLPRVEYIPLVNPCARHRRNKLYLCMKHYCTERLAIFSHSQNPTSSSWQTVIRISDPDFNPDHAQHWTQSSYDH